MTSDKRKNAIRHANKTTGTILWCGVGVFSGDGRRALDPGRTTPSKETERFVKFNCIRFTTPELLNMKRIAESQEARLRRLSHMAIDQGKYESARRLLELAIDARETAQELNHGERILYRIAG